MSASFKPHIITPTRITPQSKTLIDNIFTNFLDEDIVWGNLTCSTSDHIAQFLIYINKTLSDQRLKIDIHIRHFKNLDKTKVKEELENIDWNQILAVYCNDPNISLDIFLKSVYSILNRHVPLIRVTKRMEKTYKNPWITRGILVLIKKKNKLYNKFCQAKDPKKRKKSLQKIHRYSKSHKNKQGETLQKLFSAK